MNGKKPIIIFCEKKSTEKIVELLKAKKFEKFLVGSSFENMKTIRAWSFGILILHPEDAVGVNT